MRSRARELSVPSDTCATVDTTACHDVTRKSPSSRITAQPSHARALTPLGRLLANPAFTRRPSASASPPHLPLPLLFVVHQPPSRLHLSFFNCLCPYLSNIVPKLPDNSAPTTLYCDTAIKNSNSATRSHDIMAEPLSKVDSAVAGLPTDTKPSKAKNDNGVMNINDLEAQGIELEIAIETQKLGWKLNSSPATIEDKDVLKKPLTKPMVKKIDLVWPTGLKVTARNMKGVTIKDALDAIYKQFKKKADDELGEMPILAGFEWDKEECWTRFIVHQKKEGPAPSKKSKKKGGE